MLLNFRRYQVNWWRWKIFRSRGYYSAPNVRIQADENLECNISVVRVWLEWLSFVRNSKQDDRVPFPFRTAKEYLH